MYKCVMFDIDENGNEINKMLIEDEKPEKLYATHCDHYGDIRDTFRTLRDVEREMKKESVSYCCPECEKGSVYLSQVQEVWECDYCEWWSPVVNEK